VAGRGDRFNLKQKEGGGRENCHHGEGGRGDKIFLWLGVKELDSAATPTSVFSRKKNRGNGQKEIWGDTGHAGGK